MRLSGMMNCGILCIMMNGRVLRVMMDGHVLGIMMNGCILRVVMDGFVNRIMMDVLSRRYRFDAVACAAFGFMCIPTVDANLSAVLCHETAPSTYIELIIYRLAHPTHLLP